MYDGTKEVQLEMFNKEQIDCYKNCCERENEFKEGMIVSLEEDENEFQDIIISFNFDCLCSNNIRVENEDVTASFYDGDILQCSSCEKEYNLERLSVFELLIKLA